MQLFARLEVDRRDVARASRLNATWPVPVASVMKIGTPAIIRLNAPFMDFKPMLMLGCFHKRTWCSK